MLTPDEKKFLLALSRQAIERYFDNKQILTLQSPPVELTAPGASFVTLTKDFELRGCIGSVEAHRALYQDVIDNSIAAAFQDPRFYPLEQSELVDIAIEISVLTKPKPLAFTSPQDLLAKLTVGVDGVVLRRGTKSATYLPQVWDEILEKDNFLSTLCLKAGLPPDDWQKPGLTVETYRAEHFSE